MNDKELLRLAAKAAGIDHPGGEHSIHNDGRLWDCDKLRWWNPLTNDGDALRLAVQLQMSLSLGPVRVQACTIAGSLRNEFFQEEIIHQDSGTATRRAIVRAAAEIGKELK